MQSHGVPVRFMVLAGAFQPPCAKFEQPGHKT